MYQWHYIVTGHNPDIQFRSWRVKKTVYSCHQAVKGAQLIWDDMGAGPGMASACICQGRQSLAIGPAEGGMSTLPIQQPLYSLLCQILWIL
jgi:hypothetical protein